MTLQHLINPSLTCSANAKALGVSYRTVYLAAQRHHISLPKDKQGRPPGALSPRTIARIERIRTARAQSLSHKAIAKQERISFQAVSKLCVTHRIS